MDKNVRLEDTLNLLNDGEFIGKHNDKWVLGYLDDRGVLQGITSGDTLFELSTVVERRALEAFERAVEDIRKAGF